MRSQFLQGPRLSLFGRRAAADASYVVNGLTPQLVVDFESGVFATGGSPVPLADLLAFARSGAAVAHGPDGYLDTFADGEIRTPSYNLEDGTWVRGLTLETEARSNLLPRSDIAGWSVPTGAVVTAGGTGMDGATSAFRLGDDGAGGAGLVRVSRYQNVATATRHVFSWYFKEDQLSWMMAFVQQFTSPPSTASYFDATNGVLGASGSQVATGIRDAGHGWYRGYAAFTTDATDTGGQLDLWLADGNGDFTVDRDGTSSILFDRTQFEVGALPSSHIATSGAVAGRGAESLSIAAGDWPCCTAALSGVLIGAESFADENAAEQVRLVDMRADASNRITLSIDTDGARTGTVTLRVVNGGSAVALSAAAELPPGELTAFGVAWRVTATQINLALDGVAQTAVANTAGLPDLSSADVVLAGMGFRKQLLLWGDDIGDNGLEEASAPGHFNIEVL